MGDEKYFLAGISYFFNVERVKSRPTLVGGFVEKHIVSTFFRLSIMCTHTQVLCLC